MFFSNNGGIKILIGVFMNGRNRVFITHPKISGIRWVSIKEAVRNELVEVSWDLFV